MLKTFLQLLISFMAISACNEPGKPSPGTVAGPALAGEYSPGTFGHDLEFLSKHDSVIVLHAPGTAASVIVSAKYRGKVFTSTATGPDGISFGWVNYKAFDRPLDPHMNGYGGENRLWLGPEGGKYSLFFPPDAKMVFENWKTPAPFDSEPWDLTAQSSDSVAMEKKMEIRNYAGSMLPLNIHRTVTMLSPSDISEAVGGGADTSLHAVAYRTDNRLTNSGSEAWTEQTGAPCIWILDMMKPGPSAITVIPFADEKNNPSHIVTSNYFGQIPPDRLKFKPGVLYFKADGNSRGKLGIAPKYAKNASANYDDERKVLTITTFDIDGQARYLNQEWNTEKPVFLGDAVNAYNDGPMPDGTQMGPFYEMESVSPAALLKPGESLSHRHTVFHFTGSETALDSIVRKMIGVSLSDIKTAFH